MNPNWSNGSDCFSKGDLERDTLLDCRQKKLPPKCEIAQILCQANVPIFTPGSQLTDFTERSGCLKLSRRTVRKYLDPGTEPSRDGGGWEEKVDWEYVRQEVGGKGTTVKQIGREVAAEIEYVKFWRAFRERVGPQGAHVTIRLHHKPGEKTQVDFCEWTVHHRCGDGPQDAGAVFPGRPTV